MGSWGIQPSEFWGMGLREFGWLMLAKRPARSREWAGGLTDRDLRELTEEIETHGW